MALHGIFADAAGIRLGPVGAEEKAFVHFAIIEVKNSLAIASIDIYLRYLSKDIFTQRELFDQRVQYRNDFTFVSRSFFFFLPYTSDYPQRRIR